MTTQLTHNESKQSQEKFPIVLVCDGVRSPANIGAIFRICDALGIPEIIFCNAEINFNSARLQKTARNTQTHISHSIEENTYSTIKKLKQEDYIIIALEITDASISIENLPKLKNQKIVLVVGNEQQGVSEEILCNSDYCSYIEMYGKNSSMNVVQAASIALYTLINKFYIK